MLYCVYKQSGHPWRTDWINVVSYMTVPTSIRIVDSACKQETKICEAIETNALCVNHKNENGWSMSL
jgi:hypothetical protein